MKTQMKVHREEIQRLPLSHQHPPCLWLALLTPWIRNLNSTRTEKRSSRSHTGCWLHKNWTFFQKRSLGQALGPAFSGDYKPHELHVNPLPAAVFGVRAHGIRLTAGGCAYTALQSQRLGHEHRGMCEPPPDALRQYNSPLRFPSSWVFHVNS